MATTQEITDAAAQLGTLISKHDAAAKFEAIIKNLKDDVEAQRLLNDYHRQLVALGEKESQGQPIEVEDKRRLTALQDQVTQHPLLRNFQIVQMDYLDLMRRVDEAIATHSGAAAMAANPAAAQGPSLVE